MNFSKDKVPLFLLMCESLQLSVRAKRDAYDRLCVYVENVRIAVEKAKQIEDKVNKNLL